MTSSGRWSQTHTHTYLYIPWEKGQWPPLCIDTARCFGTTCSETHPRYNISVMQPVKLGIKWQLIMSDSQAVIVCMRQSSSKANNDIILFVRPFLSSKILDARYLFWHSRNKSHLLYVKRPALTQDHMLYGLDTVQAYNALCKQWAVYTVITLSSKEWVAQVGMDYSACMYSISWQAANDLNNCLFILWFGITAQLLKL